MGLRGARWLKSSGWPEESKIYRYKKVKMAGKGVRHTPQAQPHILPSVSHQNRVRGLPYSCYITHRAALRGRRLKTIVQRSTTQKPALPLLHARPSAVDHTSNSQSHVPFPNAEHPYTDTMISLPRKYPSSRRRLLLRVVVLAVVA